MPTYKPDIVRSYEDSHLLLFPQEKLVSREGVTDFFQTFYFVCSIIFCDITFILWVKNKTFAHEKHDLDKNLAILLAYVS